MRAIRLILLVAAVFTAILAHKTHAGSVSGEKSAADFHLKGILISQSGSSALVNNSVLREGEELNGVEILAIEEGEVRIRRGAQQLTVWVGTRAKWDLATAYKAPLPAAPLPDSQPAPAMAATSYGPVQRGETLSEIAEQHLVGHVTRHQMMVALYEANPGAFEGNINLLRQGAVLQIPEQDAFYKHAPETAVAKVLRQVDEWRASFTKPVEVAKVESPVVAEPTVTTPEVYGPVKRGETLSGIAAGLARNGSTINQVMIALFETNPQAFNGNINLLQQGAVLQIPDDTALLRYSHASATETVIDHMEAWRHGSVQLLQSAVSRDVPAPVNDSIERRDAILLSMQGHR